MNFEHPLACMISHCYQRGEVFNGCHTPSHTSPFSQDRIGKWAARAHRKRQRQHLRTGRSDVRRQRVPTRHCLARQYTQDRLVGSLETGFHRWNGLGCVWRCVRCCSTANSENWLSRVLPRQRCVRVCACAKQMKMTVLGICCENSCVCVCVWRLTPVPPSAIGRGSFMCKV